MELGPPVRSSLSDVAMEISTLSGTSCIRSARRSQWPCCYPLGSDCEERLGTAGFSGAGSSHGGRKGAWVKKKKKKFLEVTSGEQEHVPAETPNL